MKINGVDPSTIPSEDILVLPRGKQQIVFTARGLPDMDAFQALCPEPVAPAKMTSEGWKPDEQNPDYVSSKLEYNRRRLAYMVVNSLAPSNIEWDTVNIDQPGTWANWEDDMKANGKGLSQVECNLVLKLVLEVNQLDEAKLKKAREVFQLGPQQASAQLSGPSSVQQTT
jgi:hypothetical protein